MARLDFGKAQFQGRTTLRVASFVEVNQTVPVGKPKLRILEAVSRWVSFDAILYCSLCAESPIWQSSFDFHPIS